MLRFDKEMLFPPLLRSVLSVRLSINTCGLEVLLFSEFMNIVSIFLYYTSIDLIILLFILLYTFLVITFDWYKE